MHALPQRLQALLCRYSGQNDIVVGTPHMNRQQEELNSVLGCFINTLAIRVSTAEAPRCENDLGICMPVSRRSTGFDRSS